MSIHTYVYASRRMMMSEKMTVVFHDEELYTYLKVEAARRHLAASEIVADAVRQWLENHEDAELIPVIDTARTEWKEKGGHSWSDVEQKMEQAVSKREKETGAKSV
jgi:hypothetical protein